MRGYMFRNRWLALLFVGLVLAGTTRIVGTGEGDGALEQAAEEIAAQRQRAEALSHDPGATGSGGGDDVRVEFTPDEDLIDAAVGDDPTPIDEFEVQQGIDPEVVSEIEVVIVQRDGG